MKTPKSLKDTDELPRYNRKLLSSSVRIYSL